MERLTIPDVLVDEHTIRRTMIDVEAVREHAMDFYWRLKAYEDTHMMPSDVTSMRMDMAIIAALFNGVDVDRMKELAEADKDGRLVVLPFTSGRTLLYKENIDSLRLMKDVELAIRYCSSCGIVFHMGYNAFRDLVKQGRITAVSEEAERVLGAKKDE